MSPSPQILWANEGGHRGQESQRQEEMGLWVVVDLEEEESEIILRGKHSVQRCSSSPMQISAITMSADVTKAITTVEQIRTRESMVTVIHRGVCQALPSSISLNPCNALSGVCSPQFAEKEVKAQRH